MFSGFVTVATSDVVQCDLRLLLLIADCSAYKLLCCDVILTVSDW